MTDSPILRVTDLTVTAAGPSDTRLVDGASFDVFAGQRLGIIGESGSGKTLTALSALCLLYTSPSPRDRTRSRMPSSA